ncbi:MAG: hypothetical protein NTY45_07970 [Elusimicrobia bacterium]|nr:hypothetical protein [Elusimicrobiota bacterium]
MPCCFLFALFGAAAGAAQEDKAGYEKTLEQKAQGALVSLFGPGKAGVMVRAAPAGRLTVFIALSDSVTDADAQKAGDAISGLLGLAPGRGDEVLVLKPGFAPGQAEPGPSGGLGKYAPQGLGVLTGILITVLFSRLKRPAAKAAAARAPLRAAPPAQYVPPPVQLQPSSADNEDLNIKSRHGFYK